MMRDITQALGTWLEEGRAEIGQILIRKDAEFALCHIDDDDRSDLETSINPVAARELANLDDTGDYRPLKTAPNLRHGWRLVLRDLAAVRYALDYFYPAMLGVFLSQREGELRPVNLRSTLARQTGMYRITQKITDEQVEALCSDVCRSDGGCLKTILWRIEEAAPLRSLPLEKFDLAVNQTGRATACLPLPCQEACNLLVAAARVVVKKALPAPPPAP